jgi:hypothetical protein
METLKAHYMALGIPLTARWTEVEQRLRESKDSVFLATEPLEQIK